MIIFMEIRNDYITDRGLLQSEDEVVPAAVHLRNDHVVYRCYLSVCVRDVDVLQYFRLDYRGEYLLFTHYLLNYR